MIGRHKFFTIFYMVFEDCALVVQGGGTRGIYAAGVLDALMDLGIDFPYIIGTSAGALSASNFISGDRGRTKYVMETSMVSLKFVSAARFAVKGTLFNFDYLINQVPVSVSPFNYQAFHDSHSRFLVATTSLETGEPVYFEKGKIDDFFNAIAASSSLPYIAKPVPVSGHLYMDGGPVAAIPFRKAIEDGYQKIIVIETRDKTYRKKPYSQAAIARAKRFYGEHKEFTESLIKGNDTYNADVEELEKLKEAGRVFVIQPENPVHVGRAERKKAKLEALYQQAFEQTMRMKDEILAYLGGEAK